MDKKEVLRYLIAAMAMQGILSTGNVKETKDIVESSVFLADSLLFELSK